MNILKILSLPISLGMLSQGALAISQAAIDRSDALAAKLKNAGVPVNAGNLEAAGKLQGEGIPLLENKAEIIAQLDAIDDLIRLKILINDNNLLKVQNVRKILGAGPSIAHVRAYEMLVEDLGVPKKTINRANIKYIAGGGGDAQEKKVKALLVKLELKSAQATIPVGAHANNQTNYFNIADQHFVQIDSIWKKAIERDFIDYAALDPNAANFRDSVGELKNRIRNR